MDEAILKIVLQEQDGGTPGPAAPSTAASSGPATSSASRSSRSAMDMSKLGTDESRSTVDMIKGMSMAAAQTAKDAASTTSKAKSSFDTFAGILTQFRGTLGATFGKAVGTGLDIYKAFGDSSGSLGAATKGASAGAMALGISAVGAAAAINHMADLAEKYSQKYAQYSGALSSAMAQAEVTRIQNDIRRAQEHGPQLARFVTGASIVEQAREDRDANMAAASVGILNSVQGFQAMFADLGNAVFTPILQGLSDIADASTNTVAQLVGIKGDIRNIQQYGQMSFDPNNFSVPEI